MHLVTQIFGIILLPKAYSLKCYDWLDGIMGNSTGSTMDCPSQDYQCAAMRDVTYSGGSKILDLHIKGCVLPANCAQSSVNFGVIGHTITMKCCSSDLCNTEPAPDPSSSSPNGKKCYTCDALICIRTLNCTGNEDHCVSAKEKTTGIAFKGCASQMMCSGSMAAQFEENIGFKLSCCQGDLCNDASSTSVGLLLLVAPLLSVVLLS